jgi:hypothetical protein
MAEGGRRLDVHQGLFCLGTHYTGATIRGSLHVIGATSFLRCYERH